MNNKFLTYNQFLPRWMKKNNIYVLFFNGESEARKAFKQYKKTRKIPKTVDNSINNW